MQPIPSHEVSSAPEVTVPHFDGAHRATTPPRSLLKSLWGLRRLPEMARDPLAFFTKVYQEQGGVAWFDFALGRQWLISDPEAIKTVYVDHHDDLGRDAATMTLSALLGEGLLTTEGEVWRRVRRQHAPLFRARHIQHYADQMVAVAAEEPLETGLVDVHDVMMRVTSRIILDAMLGTSESEASQTIADAVHTYTRLQEMEFMSLRRFLPAFVSTPARRAAVRGRRRIEETLRPLVEARRSNPGEGVDMLSRLATAEGADGQSLTEAELRDAVATLYVGGTETANHALAFAIWLLAQRPDVQDALAEERASVLGERAATGADLKALVRHTAVMKEAMRLYPPVWGLGRRALRPFEVSGHRVEAGDQLIASAWVVHRDPRWFDQPHRFRPERFWNPPSTPRPKMAFIPYGAGPRTCIGSHFAQMEMVLVLATWLAKRRVHPVPDRPLRPVARLMLRPADGAWVDVEAVS